MVQGGTPGSFILIFLVICIYFFIYLYLFIYNTLDEVTSEQIICGIQKVYSDSVTGVTGVTGPTTAAAPRHKN